MFLWYPVMDLARAPRRTARKKGSGYENGSEFETPLGLPLPWIPEPSTVNNKLKRREGSGSTGRFWRGLIKESPR